MFHITSPLVEFPAIASTDSCDFLLKFLSHMIIITCLIVCLSTEHSIEEEAGSQIVYHSIFSAEHVLISNGCFINMC